MNKKRKEILKLAQQLEWGSYGEHGVNRDPTFKPLTKLTTSHLQNILRTCLWHIPSHYTVAIREILRYRKKSSLPNLTKDELVANYQEWSEKYYQNHGVRL